MNDLSTPSPFSVFSRLSDHGRRRIAVSCYFFLAGLCFSSWASRIPDIRQKLHLNNAALGGVLLALPVGLMVSLPIAGWMVARFGSRRMAVIGAIAYPCMLPWLGFSQTVWELVACLFFFGVSGNMLNISMNTQAIGTEVLYKRTIMASYHGIWSLAGFSGAAIGALMTGALHFPPYEHFLVISGLALVLVVASFRWLIPKDPDRPANQPIFARPDRSIVKLGIVAFCSMICEGAMFDWSGVYFQKIIQPPPGLVAAGYTAFMATMASGRFVGDWLKNRLGTRKILRLSGILTAGGLLIAILLPFFPTAILGFLLVGAGVSSVVPLIYSSAGRSKTMSPGVALAAVSTIGYLGFLFGPPCIGFIAQATSLKVSLGLIAVLGATIAVLAGKLPE